MDGFDCRGHLPDATARNKEETIVSRIMPFIAQGLQMKSTDFQISNYTLLTLLASNRSLTDEVVECRHGSGLSGLDGRVVKTMWDFVSYYSCPA